MKKSVIGLMFVLLLFCSINIAFAQNQGLLGGLETDILKSVTNILAYKVTLPHVGGIGNETVPVWALALTFMLVFSLLWIAASNIPILKQTGNVGAKKAICISLALIPLFASDLTTRVLKIITAFSGLSVLAFLVIGGYFIVALFWQGWGGASKTFAEAQVTVQQANLQFQRIENAMKYDLNSQKKAILSIRQKLTDLVGQVQGITISGRARTPPATVTRINTDLSMIITELNSLISFGKDTDRMLARMTQPPFSQTGAAGRLPARSSAVIKIQRDVDKLRNDLSATLNGIGAIISQQGITANSISKIVLAANAAINLTHQMEKALTAENYDIQNL